LRDVATRHRREQVTKNHLWSDLYRKCVFLLVPKIDDRPRKAIFSRIQRKDQRMNLWSW
jgi:hypothetical protein